MLTYQVNPYILHSQKKVKPNQRKQNHRVPWLTASEHHGWITDKGHPSSSWHLSIIPFSCPAVLEATLFPPRTWLKVSTPSPLWSPPWCQLQNPLFISGEYYFWDQSRAGHLMEQSGYVSRARVVTWQLGWQWPAVAHSRANLGCVYRGLMLGTCLFISRSPCVPP